MSADVRTHLRDMWASVAPSWGEHAEFVDHRARDITAALLAGTTPQPGDRVLELACGAGGVGLAAAQLVLPGGEVVVSDVVPAMAAIAAGRAKESGLANVHARVLDLEEIEAPDECYDVVLCREGLMFAPDPGRAAGEIHRVLRRGGRAAIAVWGPRLRNPWLGIVLDSVGAELRRPVPAPGVPGPFSLEDAGALRDLLAAAGLEDVNVSELAVTTPTGSFEEWWARTSALAGPLANILASLDADAIERIRAYARRAAGAYETPDGLEFPGVTLLATARRAPIR